MTRSMFFIVVVKAFLAITKVNSTPLRRFQSRSILAEPPSLQLASTSHTIFGGGELTTSIICLSGAHESALSMGYFRPRIASGKVEKTIEPSHTTNMSRDVGSIPQVIIYIVD